MSNSGKLRLATSDRASARGGKRELSSACPSVASVRATTNEARTNVVAVCSARREAGNVPAAAAPPPPFRLSCYEEITSFLILISARNVF